jgi:hypothetical protein
MTFGNSKSVPGVQYFFHIFAYEMEHTSPSLSSPIPKLPPGLPDPVIRTSLALTRDLNSGLLELKFCDITDLLQSPELLSKQFSSSYSILLKGILRYRDVVDKIVTTGPEVVLKISFEADPKKDNSLELEAKIYSGVINDILIHHFSPNFPVCISTYFCDGFKENIAEAAASENVTRQELYERIQDDMSQIEELNGEFYDLDQARFLLLEKVNGINLDTYLELPLEEDGEEAEKGETRTYDDTLTVLFQLMYSIRVLTVMGVRHNDLHLQNVFGVEKIPQTPHMFFITKEVYFVMNIRYLVKIIDFDLSSLRSVANTRIDTDDLCVQYGICNEENPKFDEFTVLKFIYDIAVSSDDELLVEFCLKCASQELFDLEFPRYGRLCDLDETVDPPVCRGNWIPPDQSLKTIPQILMMDEFVPYRQSLPEFDPRYIPKSLREMYSSHIYAFPTINFKELYSTLSASTITPIEFT